MLLIPLTSYGDSVNFSGTPLDPYVNAANGDTTIGMLGQIFGSMGGLLPGNSTPLSAMLAIFNTAISAVGVFVLCYSLGAGTIQTAHDGEFLGKRYSSLWMPIRVVVGVSSILPVVGGWALAQLIMTWGAKVGIGIANLVWAAAVSAMLALSNNVVNPQAAVDDTAVKGILRAETCMIGHNKMLDDSGMPTTQHFTMKVKNDYAVLAGIGLNTADRYAILFGGDGTSYSEDACGGVSVPISSSIMTAVNATITGGASIDTGDIVRIHAAALQTMASSLMPVAQQIVDGQTPDPSVFAQVKQAYINQVTSSISGKVQQGNSAIASFLGGVGKSWIFAGAIYQKVAAVNRDIIDAATLKVNVIDRTSGGADTTGNIMNDGIELGNNRYDGYMSRINQSESMQGSGGLLDRLFGQSVISPILNGAFSAMTFGQTDPIVAMTNLGYTIVAGGLTAWGVSTMTAATAEAAAGSKLLGTGVGAPSGTISATLGFVDLMLLSVIGVGLYYCAYLPFVPFLEWFGAVVSYFIIVLEGIVAAVLWGLAHLETEGEGLPQRSIHGYMFFLNLLLRPTLMVIGLVGGGLILVTMGAFLQLGLSILFGANNPYPGIASLLLFIASLVIMASMMNSLIHRAFGLVHVLPDQVLTWIGAHLGQQRADHESRQTVVGAIGTTKDAIRGGVTKNMADTVSESSATSSTE